MKTISRPAAAIFAGAALLLASGGRVEAQPANAALSERAYERIRAMSDDLDRAAQHAAEAARRSRSGIYGSDRGLQRAVSNFARRARAFDQRIGNYRTAPWQVDDELRGLLADARSVEARVEQSRLLDPHVREDWNRNVGLLNQMIEIYREDGDRGGYGDRRDRRRDGRDEGNRPDNSYREDRGGRTEGPAYRDDRGRPGGRTSLAGLVSDVSERANRLAERARQLAGAFPVDARQRNAWQAIQRLSQDASALGVRIDRDGQPRDLKTSVARLNAEASDADRQMRQGNVFPEIKSEWADLMQALQRLSAASGA